MYQNVPLVAGAVIAAAAIWSAAKRKAIEKRISQGKSVVSNPTAYDTSIIRYAEMYSVDPKVLKAKIYWESGFNPSAVSPVGAKGLAQVLTSTWNYIWSFIIGETPKSPFDPDASIKAAAAYLRYLLDKFGGDYNLALAAYNAGETSVMRAVQSYKDIKSVISSLPYETRAYLYGIGTLAQVASV